MSVRVLIVGLTLATIGAVAGVHQVDAAHAKWRWATVLATSYSTKEALTGCTGRDSDRDGEQDCYTACPRPWHLLHDSGFTVATNPALGLACGTPVVLRKWAPDRTGRYRLFEHRATVTDRTASHFGVELSYVLSLALGARASSWDSPRWVSLRVGP